MCTAGRAVRATGSQDFILERAPVSERVVEKQRQFFKNHEGVGGLLAVRLVRKEVGKTGEEGRVKCNGKKI